MSSQPIRQLGTQEPKAKSNTSFPAAIIQFLRNYPILVIAVLIWLSFALTTENFATIDNLSIILAASAVILVASTGQTLVLLTGGIDASVATVAACSAVIAAAVMGREGSALVGLLIAVGVGSAFGLLNGFAVAYLRLTPLVLTLGTMLVARGIAFSVSQGIAMRVPRELRDIRRIEFLEIPAIAIVALIIVIVFGLLLSRTSWGRHVYLLGNNEQGARYVGIRYRLVKASVYIICGALGGLAGYLSIINLGVAIPGVGDTILLTIIGGVIVGGTSLFGGEGSIWRTVVGVLLLTSLGNGLNLLGFEFYDQLVVEGIVILVGATLAVRLSQSTS